MAAEFLLIQPQSIGEMYISAKEVVGPASYVTGGQQLDPATFALVAFKALICDHMSPDGTYFGRFVAPEGPTFGGSAATAAKLVWFVTATGAEVGAGINLSGESLRVVAIGN